MMGRSHLITGACALEHIYAADVIIARIDFAPVTAVWEAVRSYLGISKLSLFTIPVCLAAYFFGTLLPDIDNPDSILGRIIYVPAEHRKWFHAIYLYLIIGGLKWILPLIVKGFDALEGLHPMIAACHPVFAVITAVFNWLEPVSAWIFFGVVVHLFWDSLSYCGNCWFYKLFSDYKEYPGGAKIKKGHTIKLYRTGEWSEYLLLFIVVILTVMSFIWIRKGW